MSILFIFRCETTSRSTLPWCCSSWDASPCEDKPELFPGKDLKHLKNLQCYTLYRLICMDIWIRELIFNDLKTVDKKSVVLINTLARTPSFPGHSSYVTGPFKDRWTVSRNNNIYILVITVKLHSLTGMDSWVDTPLFSGWELQE